MVWKLMLIVSIGIVLPIMYFVMRFEGKPKQNMMFGVSIKKSYWGDSRVKAIQQKYDRELNGISLILLVSLLLILPIKYFSIVYTLTMAWLLATIVLTIVPFAHANRKLLRLKYENNWYMCGVEKRSAETEKIGIQCEITGKIYYLAAIIVSVVMLVLLFVLWGMKKTTLDFVITAVSLDFTTLFLAAIGIVFQRRKITVRKEHLELDMEAAKKKSQIWGRSLGCLSWINAIYSMGLLMLLYNGGHHLFLISFVSILYMVIVFWLIIDAGMKTREEEEKRRKLCEFGELEEEDSHWIFGIIYYNKEDAATFKDNRIGTGYTFNMAKRGAKVLMAFVILCLLLLPISSIIMIADEFTPISLDATQTTLKVTRYKVDYTIDRNKITEIKLLDALPDLAKTSGTSMDTLKKGRFSSKEYGSVKACLNPKKSCFLLIKTEDNTYIVNDSDDSDTKSIYEELKNNHE